MTGGDVVGDTLGLEEIVGVTVGDSLGLEVAAVGASVGASLGLEDADGEVVGASLGVSPVQHSAPVQQAPFRTAGQAGSHVCQ